MGFFSKIFGRKAAPGVSHKEGPRPGFFDRLRERAADRKRAREWKRSQDRMEKMEKENLREKMKRKAEEREQKRAAEEKSREYHERGRETFQDRWNFSDKEYDDFIHFIDGTGEDLKEAFGSNNLVEAFRTGRNLGLSPEDMQYVLKQTYDMTEGGTQEDIINDLYSNMEAYAGSVSEGSYV